MSNSDSSVPYGYCQCGCGEKTSLWKRTTSRRNRLAGEPSRYIRGHNQRLSGIEYIEEDRGYSTPCWIWQRSIGHFGHGQITIEGVNGKTTLHAHRALYMRHRGSVPPNKELDHVCRVPACVNPWHLEAVTHTENVRRGATPKLSMEEARRLRKLYATEGFVITHMARQLGVSDTTISYLLKNKTWRE